MPSVSSVPSFRSFVRSLGSLGRAVGGAHHARTAVVPFTDALDATPAPTLVTSGREIPTGLVALATAPDTSAARRLELVEAMLAGASDRSGDGFLPWWLTTRALADILDTASGELPTDRLALVRWKVVEFAAGAGLPAETRQAIAAAAAYGPLPLAVLQSVPTWSVGSSAAAHVLLGVIDSAVPTGAPSAAVSRAVDHLTSLLEDSHAAFA